MFQGLWIFQGLRLFQSLEYEASKLEKTKFPLTENIFCVWDFDTPFSIDYNYCGTKVQRLRSKRQIFNEISFSSSQNPLVFFIFKCIKHVLLQTLPIYRKIKKWYFVTKILLTYCKKKLVLVIEKNFWNSRLKAENLQNFWDH